MDGGGAVGDGGYAGEEEGVGVDLEADFGGEEEEGEGGGRHVRFEGFGDSDRFGLVR